HYLLRFLSLCGTKRCKFDSGFFNYRVECLQMLGSDGYGHFEVLTKRIHLFPVLPETIAHMRPRCQSGTSHITNNLALLNSLTRTHRAPAHMQVLRRICFVMFDFYVVAVSLGQARIRDHSIPCGNNGSAVRGCIICSQMSFVNPLYGMQAALREARTDAA